jgi:2-C-methyl-D-erythritol 4-phosphate cytidylyltransferase
MGNPSAQKCKDNWREENALSCFFMLSAVIVAAGSSQRMGFDKLLALLGDKPVLAHTIDAFERTLSVDEIIVVARPERVAEFKELVRQNGFQKVRDVIRGGERRQDSVRAGLERLNSETTFVAVHDAARPLVGPEQIERVFELARTNGGAALAEPITNTLKRADEDGVVTGGVPRENLFAMQTPQVFARELLDKAYAAVAASGLSVTDEVSAVEHLGAKIVLLPNDDWNVKITYPRDLLLAEAILARRR